ncbi:M23 family metallopeptidase [Chamaesiphon sp.]|uniref:M23 family metallopeptidase n=1 Tax=Chamaesiphon sp. TaxID=2814140 RepID=UPI0035946A6D
MSSKAEKTSHHLYHQPRLSIFFRNPLLLEIVAWLVSLGFIGSTGVVWADLKPISTSKAEAQALQNASTSAEIVATERQIYGYRVVPKVVSLPTAKSISPRLDRSRAISTAPQRPTISTPGTSLAGITPMKSPAMGTLTAQSEPRSMDIITAGSIEILVPAPKTQRIEVQPVARLPQISEIKTVPTVSTIPSVRPSQSPVAFANIGQNELSELIYPLSAPAPTTSNFGWRTHPITGSRRFHSGIDIGAPTGAPVVAAGSGTIVSSGWVGGYGKAIVVQHNGVQQTLYGHLSEIFVQPGQIVEQGTVIGRVGSTGNSTGPHLHYEIRVSTPDGWIAVDPGENIKYALDYLRRSMPFAQRDLPPGYN